MAQKMNIGDSIPPPSLCLTAVQIKLHKAITYNQRIPCLSLIWPSNCGIGSFANKLAFLP